MNMTIDRRSKTPLSQQLEIELRAKMIRGELHQSMVLPEIELLAEELGLLPQQVKAAYDALVSSNHILHKNDQWVVNYGRISKLVFEKFTSLYDIIRLSGATPSILTLIIKKDYKLSKNAELELPFKKVLYTKRVYCANDKPQVIMDCYFPQDLYPGLETILESNEPYYDAMKSKYGFDISRSDRTVEAENLKKKEAEIFGVPVGSGYCYSIVKTYDTADRLIELDVCWILPDTMHFNIEEDE
jgi:DNA-binding GntR family transcriptional regulator